MSDLPVPQFLDERVARWAATKSDEEAVTYLGRTWTWSQWYDRVQRLAGALNAWGIGRGSTVAFVDKNHPACVELTLAAGLLGAGNAIINFRLAADELDYVLNDCGAKVVVVGEELRGNIDAIADRLTAVEHIVTVTPEGTEGDEYEELIAGASPVGRALDVRPDDVCIVMYSSGTTGRPKGIALTHANVIAHTVNAFEGWTLGDGDKSLVAMPLFHVGGSSYMQWGLHHGAPTYMTREVDGMALAGGILAGANRTFLVPAVLAKVLDTGEDAVKLFGGLKTFAYGASPMPLPLLRSALQAWPETEFIQVYGLTEVCGAISLLGPEDHRGASEARLMSAGTVIRNAEVRVVDPDTLADVPVGEQGELWFRTPQLMKGYLNRPEDTAETITPDGWFRTGDIGRVDDGGYIFVEDRLKDMIISGGENIYSIEVERVLAEHPAVVEVAVIGVPDEKWGESVKAVVTLDGDVTDRDLIAFARERLAAYKCPKSVDIVEELPRNPTGKILKKELRKPYWEGRDRTTV
ncbi:MULTISPECIES: long-chain-fatty-acid--CoA ligase [unclassified Mycolicibacterium]|uniref:long-chain-fatty-acid--CoA ligase n=1 Tax=unclassified Mycolicibacterium TaxID=2636767 RepID=UPI0012DCCF12|nr:MULTISPECIES: long-chain-fatty-acid--CoA ligase [unclassified Mycolicibacterium]MUL81632.1 long-chain-fatty-acid--CoA ligase [Mycolicibacterium sp. CBMA 329]MUL87398.1 long-chain-fatty-acid--CoA ligase [Mycolicibacterium sp. CBMA 331]MUL99736.1 long-chain-fatty-acid--CoA ligase [Mycolicibacterium sp. CBMA 334]MUM25354.1 long-chain-fatty-acid--CoA ligase [Mycolicibacterium sp. CBMA 295]MUM37695.1 long-chain-fatty-acid--CoA ligase [Mycolicibacterium sp. CBMA 247]